jgi:hypothetical protein
VREGIRVREITNDEGRRLLQIIRRSSGSVEVLYWALEGQRRQGRTVTAGKILYGKRPKLLPLYDSYVRTRFGITYTNIWEAYWCILQDKEVRRGVAELRELVPLARSLSLIRIIDILGWMP